MECISFITSNFINKHNYYDFSVYNTVWIIVCTHTHTHTHTRTHAHSIYTHFCRYTHTLHCIYDTYYFNIVSVDNIGRSGNHNDNGALLSISKICWLFFIVSTVYIKKHLKNERVCRDIKTKKAQEQDWDGMIATKLTNHFHITTLHEYVYNIIARAKVKHNKTIHM